MCWQFKRLFLSRHCKKVETLTSHQFSSLVVVRSQNGSTTRSCLICSVWIWVCWVVFISLTSFLQGMTSLFGTMHIYGTMSIINGPTSIIGGTKRFVYGTMRNKVMK